MNDYITKICKTCENTYPATDEYFYRHTYGSLNGDCISCYKIKRYANRNKASKLPSNLGEILAIEYLKSVGIYATSGKASIYRRIDVIAWGCVKIEVKHSQEFKWSFKFGNNKPPDIPDVTMLIGLLDGVNKFYLFPYNHPVFFRDNNSRKTQVNYIPNVSRKQHKYMVLNERLLLEHENNTSLIEIVRQGIINNLLRL